LSDTHIGYLRALLVTGCKANNVDIVYTLWSNLKKTPDMDVGQVGFHKQKEVRVVDIKCKYNIISSTMVC